jgi:hypothetical protein
VSCVVFWPIAVRNVPEHPNGRCLVDRSTDVSFRLWLTPDGRMSLFWYRRGNVP